MVVFGVATLDWFGKVVAAQLNIQGTFYQGNWCFLLGGENRKDWTSKCGSGFGGIKSFPLCFYKAHCLRAI